ncbi:hypothetical protein SPURM210S_08209 [Streptomyces purpurascens]
MRSDSSGSLLSHSSTAASTRSGENTPFIVKEVVSPPLPPISAWVYANVASVSLSLRTRSTGVRSRSPPLTIPRARRPRGSATHIARCSTG